MLKNLKSTSENEIFKGETVMADSTFDLTGKTALVTGGNGGIGLGMAEALAQSGADICIWGQNEEKNSAYHSGDAVTIDGGYSCF